MKSKKKKVPRNPACLPAKMRNAGKMKDKRDRRGKEKKARLDRGEDE